MTRAALEAAIRAHPDDGAAYDVYADWLSSHGELISSHGELIALERANDDHAAIALAEHAAMLPRPRELSVRGITDATRTRLAAAFHIA